MHLSPPSAPEHLPQTLESRAQRSREAWRRLGLRFQSITPSLLARSVLVAAAVGALAWVTAMAWTQLVPFQLGFVVAYITLPLVNWLDRYMPRWVAASVLVLVELGAILGFFALVVPPLAEELAVLVASIPDPDEARTWLDSLRTALETLPPPVQELVKNGVEQLSANVRANAPIYLQALLQVALGTVVSLFGTLGFLVGFLGIPTWLVAVMSDQRAGVRVVDRVLPRAVRPDFWAVVRILDRTFSAFVRGQFLLGVITGLLVYVGYAVLEQLGIMAGQFRVVLAVTAGVAQLIPAVGPILGAIPAVAVGFAESPTVGVATIAMFVGIQFLVGALAQPLVADRYVTIHPAIFVIILVLLSQFGFLWLLVAAPLSVALRDLYRYAYGRLSDPPLPAGVAPGESMRVPVLQRVARAGQGVSHG